MWRGEKDSLGNAYIWASEAYQQGLQMATQCLEETASTAVEL